MGGGDGKDMLVNGWSNGKGSLDVRGGTYASREAFQLILLSPLGNNSNDNNGRNGSRSSKIIPQLPLTPVGHPGGARSANSVETPGR